MTTADGTTYHFRSEDYETIYVIDAFKHGERIADIRSPQDAEDFIARVVERYRLVAVA